MPRALGSPIGRMKLAHILGVNESVLTLWEEHGLVSPTRDEKNFRSYLVAEVTKARRLRVLMDQDCTINEMVALMRQTEAA